MASVEVLFTERIGQLTGSTRSSDPTWIRSVDAMQWPLLNDTGRWGVMGVDLGANTEDSDGRLYIFFGDVAVEQDRNFPGFSGNPNNSDLVAWTDDTKVLRHGGHLALGWNFFLPSKEQGATESSGQPDWHLCSKCGGLFWAPNDQPSGICPKGDNHQPIGWNFVLPNKQQGATDATGQGNWRFCDKCNGLFWAPEGKPNGVCPKDGLQHNPQGWIFYLPNEPIDPDENPNYRPGSLSAKGQPFWRFCIYCKGLFWAGDGFKGLCPGAPGGGSHLHLLLKEEEPQKGKFAPLTSEEPIGITQSLEVTSGAFSHLGRIYLFVNMSEASFSERPRGGDPAYGLYMVMKDRPGVPGVYQKQFLFSPRIGQCPKDETRSSLESHEILGFKFVLPHAPADSVPGPNTWRLCKKCGTMFWNGAFPSMCWKGGTHEPDSIAYTLEQGATEDHQHQSNWRVCQDCSTLFWDGEQSGLKGRCPAGGHHRGTGDPVRLPYLSIMETATSQKNWRFCEKCAGLFYWNGDPQAQNFCPKDRGQHVARGFDFVLPHDIAAGTQDQPQWRFCLKCHGLFWAGDTGGICPRDGLPHDDGNVGYHFVLRHDVVDDLEHQKDWRFCLKCAGLFWAGGDHGICPKDGLPHDHGNVGFNFVLPHNPGE